MRLALTTPVHSPRNTMSATGSETDLKKRIWDSMESRNLLKYATLKAKWLADTSKRPRKENRPENYPRVNDIICAQWIKPFDKWPNIPST